MTPYLYLLIGYVTLLMISKLAFLLYSKKRVFFKKNTEEKAPMISKETVLT